MRLLSEKSSFGLDVFIQRCRQVGVVECDLIEIRRVAEATIKYLRGTKVDREHLAELQRLERFWYAALAKGGADYSVYSSPLYLAELWACWIVYSRKYLVEISKPKNLPPDGIIAALGQVSKVVDLGCGFGYTTAALKAIFPGASVFGTNLPDTVQTMLAKSVGADFGFSIVPDVEEVGPADLVVAFEYFEHFDRPLEHLRHVLRTTRPRAILLANSFGTIALGHFERYWEEDYTLDGKKMSALFNRELKDIGYSRVKTKLWNSRPALLLCGQQVDWERI